MNNSNLQSKEDAEFGQELIDFLLQTGLIKEKSNIFLQNAAFACRNERMKNDRYDELIAAFNVILEEILQQGNSRATTKDFSSNIPNHITNDQESDANKQTDGICKTGTCTKNPPSTDPMDRCLSQCEKELLQRIKTLTNQLNSAMEKRDNNKEANDNLYE